MSNKDCINYFDKNNSVILGGIAILFMIWHHLFNVSEWLSNGVAIIIHGGILGNLLTYVPAATGNICVQIFAIISGYALFINPKSYGNWRLRVKRLLKFLLAYWIVFALFLLIAWFNNDSLPSWNQFFHNLVGLKTGPSQAGVNVPFAWYVAFYIQFIILTPLLTWIFQKGNLLQDICGLLFLAIMVYLLPKINPTMVNDDNEMFLRMWLGIICLFFSNIHPIFCVGLGIIAAKYNIFFKVHKLFLKKFPSLVILLFVGLGLYIKYKLSHINIGGGYNWYFSFTICYSFMAMFMVSFLLELINRIKSKILTTVLTFFGTLSMYLWFLHGIFFTGKNFLQVQLYASKEPIIIFIFCLAICTPVAYLIYLLHTFLWNKLDTKPKINNSTSNLITSE